MGRKPTTQTEPAVQQNQPVSVQDNSQINSNLQPLTSNDVSKAETNVASSVESKPKRQRRTKAEMAAARGGVVSVSLPPANPNAVKILDKVYTGACTGMAALRRNTAYIPSPDHTKEVAELAEECMRIYLPQIPTKHATAIALIFAIGTHFGGAELVAFMPKEQENNQGVEKLPVSDNAQQSAVSA